MGERELSFAQCGDPLLHAGHDVCEAVGVGKCGSDPIRRVGERGFSFAQCGDPLLHAGHDVCEAVGVGKRGSDPIRRVGERELSVAQCGDPLLHAGHDVSEASASASARGSRRSASASAGAIRSAVWVSEGSRSRSVAIRCSTPDTAAARRSASARRGGDSIRMASESRQDFFELRHRVGTDPSSRATLVLASARACSDSVNF